MTSTSSTRPELLRPGRLSRFAVWLAEALNHAFGNPREEAQHRPPLVGTQPYRDRPPRRR